MHGFDRALQTLAITAQHMGIGQDKADGLSQLMATPATRRPQGGDFFRVQQLLLGALEGFMGFVQLAVGVLEFAQRPPQPGHGRCNGHWRCCARCN